MCQGSLPHIEVLYDHMHLAELHDEVDLCEAVHTGQLAPGLRHATVLLQIYRVSPKTRNLAFDGPQTIETIRI